MKGLGFGKKCDYKEAEGMGFQTVSLVELGVQKRRTYLPGVSFPLDLIGLFSTWKKDQPK